MDKKFEKKTVFMGVELSGMDQLAFTALTKQLAQHIIECHAEIIRLTEELSSLRSQAPERKRTNREENKVFPEAGVWFYQNLHGVRGVEIVESDRNLVEGYEYTLILAEKDFLEPPKPEPPLEVKVGKYDVPGQGTAEVLSVIGDKCWYVTTAGKHEVVPVANVRYWFKSNGAVFIGGGDDAE